MLSGQFLESNQTEVQLQMTGSAALTCLVHYLYDCHWCSTISGMPVQVLLELSILTDKYLLSDFNKKVSSEIIRRLKSVEEVVTVYEASLLKEYPIGKKPPFRK